MDKPLRLKLKKCYHLARPAHVVNACFIAVLFFSTLLIWREINVLEEAYGPTSVTIWLTSLMKWMGCCSSTSTE